MKIASLLLVILSFCTADVNGQSVPVDIHGDALPRHAIGRLGTTRFLANYSAAGQIVWSPNGKLLASLSNSFIGWVDPGIQIWDPITGLETGPPELMHHQVHQLAWAPDSRRIAVCHDSGSIEIWNVISRKRTRTIATADSGFKCVDWSSNGRWIAAGRKKGTLSIFDATSGTIEKTFDQPVTSLRFSSDSKWLATCIGSSAGVWKMNDGTLRHQIKLDAEPPGLKPLYTFAVEIAPVGQSLVVTGNRTSFVDLSGKSPVVTLLMTRDGNWVSSFSADFTADGSQFVTGDLSQLSLWDSSQQTLLREYPDEGGFFVALSPDGTSLAAQLRRVSILDIETGLERRSLSAHRRPVAALAFSPDGQAAYTCSSGPTVRKWETQSTRPSGELKLSSGTARAVSVSRDNKLVAVAAGSRVYFFDADTLKPAGEPVIRQSIVTSVAFSPTDDLLVAQSTDGIVNFVDPVSRKTITTTDLRLPGNYIGHSIFSHDGRHLALTSPFHS
jgi:WD40 repeat protein